MSEWQNEPENPIPTAEAIARHVEAQIRKGDLQPGDRLPGEHELARTMAVSRAVVREALNGLRARGIVTVLPGKGSYVAMSLPRSIQDFSLFGTVTTAEWSETRWHIETINAQLAAKRRTDEDLANLTDILIRSQQETDPDEWVRLDTAFHVLLAEATHNKILARLSRDIRGLQSAQSRRVSFQPGQIEAANIEHEALLEAIRERNPLRSTRWIRKHLTRIQAKSSDQPTLQAEEE